MANEYIKTTDVKGTFVCVRIADADKISESSQPNEWLTKYQRVLDFIVGELPEVATITQIYQDGVLVFFRRDINAVVAVNTAIKIHQKFAKTPVSGSQHFSMKIGIATSFPFEDTSEVLIEKFSLGGGSVATYIGFPAMTAERLVEQGSARALFIDKRTYSAGDMSQVVSDVGVMQQWSDDQYVSPQKRVVVPGIERPIEYHDVLWDGNRHPLVTEGSSPEVEKPVRVDTAPQIVSSQLGVLRGRVSNVRDDKGFCFVDGDDGQSYFAHFNEFVDDRVVAVGDMVFFHPRPAAPGKTNPSATALILKGSQYRGAVTNVRDGFCFLEIQSGRSETHDIFYFFGRSEDTPPLVGQTGSFTLDENLNRKKSVYTPCTNSVVWD